MKLNPTFKIGTRPSGRFNATKNVAAPGDTAFSSNRKSKIENRKSKGVALVITLLMLSIITFLAVAFLAVTRRNREATTSALDQSDARTMQDIAMTRAQAEIIAHMQANGTVLNYDLMSSHNFIKTDGFTNQTLGQIDTNNVNYDMAAGGGALTADQRVQNIGNLMFDPRVPVYVTTNRAGSNDFRFWIDLNRNGLFETNGYQAVLDDNGNAIPDSARGGGTFVTNYFDGEPEWIGLLSNPEQPHSARNRFLGRYAYVVLPIGKTLDINYIHNHANSPGALTGDGYLRNQGFGSWELNLGAYLRDLNTNAWNSAPAPYAYTTNSGSGALAFLDALNILSNRYGGTFSLPTMASAQNFFGAPVFGNDFFDAYANGPFFVSTNNAENDVDTVAWSGSDNPNAYYNILDEAFDASKTLGFPTRLQNIVTNSSSANRYTFQRLLATLGTDSAPELQTRVHGNMWTNSYDAAATNFIPRTKVNINYSNTVQILNNLNSSPTNLARWDVTNFFLKAADILLRSQVFTITNQVTTNGPVFTNYLTFGVTNIPIYSPTNNGLRYNEDIHRMLQLAANIYDAANYTNDTPVISFPSVFRPLCQISNNNVYIIGWEPVLDYNQFLGHTFKAISDPSLTTNDVPWGIPLIIGAKKGLPNFNEYSYTTSLGIVRKLNFIRLSDADTNRAPNITNQFYTFSISNLFGVEVWNSYRTQFSEKVTFAVTNEVSVIFTNNWNFGTNFTITNSSFFSPTVPIPRWNGTAGATNFVVPLITNTISLPQSYFSETKPGLILFSNTPTGGSYLSTDTNQTGWPVHGWRLYITNRLMYAMVDTDTSHSGAPRILDFVNLADFGGMLDVTQELTRVTALKPETYESASFSPTHGSDVINPNAMSFGMSNQIVIGKGLRGVDDWPRTQADRDGITGFIKNLQPGYGVSLNFWDPFEPNAIIRSTKTWQANDPLVHYTTGDLSSSKTTNIVDLVHPTGTGTRPATNNIGHVNGRYEAWPDGINYLPESQVVGDNMTFKDPQMTNSEAWNFPTNLFPSIGWLGRVHRGTPWQTMFLKADTQPDYQTWTNKWVSSFNSYPTNDYRLFDLFSVAPNDNALRGTLSVNQTNRAAWSALLSGVLILTNANKPYAIDPADVPGFLESTNGINAVRKVQPFGVFQSVGDILSAGALTTQSPLIGGTPDATKAFHDEVVERIPQQILSLLRVGQPRFVIYAYGQSLKPKDIVLNPPSTPNDIYFNLCTNYTITGEFVTRTVCHVEGDVNKPKIVVDNFNILTGE